MTHNGCDISPHATIGAGLQMPHPQGIVVGPEVVIGPRVRLGQHSTLGMGGSGSPRLGAGVTIGIGAVVFGGIGLGEESVVAANSVLRIDVPARTLAAGNPAVLKGVLQRYRE
jgi:serine O-acetyltransferase